MKRKILALILVLCCICSQAGTVTFAAETGTGEESSSVVTGTWGVNDGFEWSYEPNAKTLRVTGEDVGTGESILKSISYTIEKVIFEDCVFSGSLACLLKSYSGSNLISVEFNNCDTSNVTDMRAMFYYCSKLRNLDLSGFDTSKVKYMTQMFYACNDLSNLDLSEFDTSNVVLMNYMFHGCNNLTNIDISGFDTSKVTNMSHMFSCCSSLTTIDVSGFDTSEVTDMGGMFQCGNSLTTIDVSGFDTSNVTDMSSMFFDCSMLKSIDISGFDTSNVIDMGNMFNSCTELKSIDVSGFDTSEVTYMGGMFKGCTELKNIDVSGFDTSNVRKMPEMFYGCNKLTTLDLSGFDTSKLVGDLDFTFMGCDNLKTVYTPKTIKRVIPLPGIFYDLNLNSVEEITSEYCSTVLTKDIKQESDSNNIVINLNEKNLITVRNTAGDPISYAIVRFGDNECRTDLNGEVVVDKEALFASDTLEVSSLEGYCTYTLDISEINEDTYCINVVLYRTGEQEVMLKYVTHYDEDYETTDLLTETITYNIVNEYDVIKILCKAMDPDEVEEYQLWQKKKKIATSTDGIFTLRAGDGFEAGGGCYIRVIGKTVAGKATPINLSFVEIEVNAGSEISLMDEALTIGISEDVPFFGGSEIEIDMPSLPIDIEVDRQKFYIGINTDIIKAEMGENLEEYFDDLKETFDAVKSANSITLGKKHAEEMKKFIKDTEAFKLPGGDFEVDIAGYAECEAGEKIARGQLYIMLSAESPTLGFTTWVSVVPVTVQFKATAEVKATAEISYDIVKGEFGGELALDIEVGVEAFGGIGVGTIVGVGAYGEAGVAVGIKVLGEDTGLEHITLNGELGLKAYLGPFTYKKSFAEAEWVLYSKPEVEGVFACVTPERLYSSLYTADNYKTQSLDYLSEESDWCGYPVMPNDVEVSTNFMSLVENTYLNAQPVMVADGDVLYATFLGADETTGEIYVQCTKMENGAWCEPVRVDSEAILDDAPQLLIDNDGNVWLAYAKTNEAYEEGSLLSYANNQSIVVGTLDKDTLTFTEAKEYDSTAYEHDQQLSLVNGVPTLSWIASAVTDDNSVLASLNNVIVSASYTDGKWSDSAVVKSVNSYIGDMAIGDIGVAYVIDEDNDLTTTNDKTLIYCDWQGKEQSTVEGVTGNVTYGVLPGETEGTFIWNATDKLCSMEDSVDVAGITSEYVINSNSIYYSMPVEGGAELSVVRRNSDGTYSAPIQLTDTDRYIENISVATALGKDIVLGMHTSAEITSSAVNTSKNLVWSIIQPVNDIRIDEVYYDTSVTTPDETLPVTLTVTNAGENEVNEISISLDGTVVSTQSISLQPGESKDVTFEMTYPDALSEYTVKIEDTVVDSSLDYNSGDNSQTFKLGLTNLKVDASFRKIGINKAITAMVTNDGTDKASGSVALFDEDGKLLTAYAFTDLERGNTLLVDLPLDSEASDCVFSVVVSTAQEEIYTYDNTDTVYVPVEEGFYIVNYVLDGGTQNSENPTFYYGTDEDIKLLAPTKKYHEFDGWYTDIDYTTKIGTIASGSKGNITLYAKWIENVSKNGLYEESDGNWYYYVNNEIDTSLTGMINTNIGWVYLTKGKLDASYTGLAKNKYGWWYIKEGKLDWTYTGLAKNSYGWWYVTKGKLDTTYTGIAKNAYGWWYVKEGKVDFTYTGMATNAHGTWYMNKGKLDTSVSGFIKTNIGWVYLTKGKLDTTVTSLVKNKYGWWYVKEGKLDLTYTGLANNKYGTWFVTKGKLDQTVNGMIKANSTWVYMVNGLLDTTYTGMAKNKYGWWHMTNGYLNLKYTGISTNKYGMWYMTKGKLDLSYTGKATYNGVLYDVVNGQVVD